MRLRHFGFAFTQAIVVCISMVLFKTCFLLWFALVPLSSRGIENLQSRIAYSERNINLQGKSPISINELQTVNVLDPIFRFPG